MNTFWLSMHVPYGCRHRGACCSSKWAIPLETTRVQAIRGLQEDGDWLVPAPDAPADVAGVLAISTAGHCVFHRQDSSRPGAPTTSADSSRRSSRGVMASEGGCAIQHALGHTAMPSACQHFPRECLIDPRGVFVTLSHYCPTAADLLFEHSGAVEIVDGPAAVPNGSPEGLDARDGWPPFLTPGVLMDLEGYAAWEAHVVRVLAGGAPVPAGSPDLSLRLLNRQARSLAAWRPGGRSLSEAVRSLDIDAHDQSVEPEPDWAAERHLFDLVRASLPPSHAWADYPPDAPQLWRAIAGAWYEHATVINRLLAAHSFASWMAYQGHGLLPLLRRLDLALAVLRAEVIRVCAGERVLTAALLKEAIRQTDLLLVHLADRVTLAQRLSHGSA